MKTVKDYNIGRYNIKIVEVSEEFKFIILDQNKKTVGRGSYMSLKEATEQAENMISLSKSESAKKRMNGIPTADEFTEALNHLNLPSGHWDMLKAHYRAPQRKLTSLQLAEAAGYKHFSAANSQYGTLGRKIAEFLGVVPEGTYSNGEPLWITILTKANSEAIEADTGYYQHILRDEVARALENVGNN